MVTEVRPCQWCGYTRGEGSAFDIAKARNILAEVAVDHEVSVGDMIGKRRDAIKVAARRCAIRRIRDETDLPLKAIGLIFDIDASSVSHHLNPPLLVKYR